MSKFEQFIKERRYLQNVSERTVQWYHESLKWLRVCGMSVYSTRRLFAAPP